MLEDEEEYGNKERNEDGKDETELMEEEEEYKTRLGMMRLNGWWKEKSWKW